MLTNRRLFDAKKVSHLLLGQPNGLAVCLKTAAISRSNRVNVFSHT